MKASLRETLWKLVLMFFTVLLVLPIMLGTLGNLTHKSYALALFMAVCVFFLLHFGREKTETLHRKVNGGSPLCACVVLSAACLLINGGFAFYFRPVQAADYRTFFQVAKDLSAGVHPGMKDYVAMFPHILGYASFLSVFLRIFGQSLMVAVAVNVILTTLTGVILFYITYRMTDLLSAAAVYLLWIICPSKMFYNTMSLSEPYYTFLLMLVFLLIEWFTGQADTANSGQLENERPGWWAKTAIAAAACGGSLALVQATRPIAPISIIALALWLVFLMNRNLLRKQWRGWVIFLVLLLIGYRAGGTLWRNYATEQLEQTPPAIPGYNIYVGFNLETNGSYSDEDMDLLQSRYFGEYERNAVAAQQSMLRDARERIIAARPAMTRLMLVKLKTLLSHDEGGVFYAMESLSSRQYAVSCVLSNIWYYFVSMLAISGVVSLWRNRDNSREPEQRALPVVILFAIGLVLAQLLVEVAARYHYVLIPILLLIAGFAFQKTTQQGYT